MGELEVGYNLSTSAAPGADPVADAREAQALGFDFVAVTDHLHGDHPTFETWTLLTWVAAHTERVRLVTNVLGAPYRPAPVVAKMAEGLQRLSGGRLVLGLGAGGSDDEFEAFGLGAPTGGEKVAALEEAVEAMRLLWSGPAAILDGRYHRLQGASATPRPDVPIPIWVGAYGPRMLDLVGRRADGWLPSMFFAPPERGAGMRDRVHRAAEAAGRDPAAITFAYNVGVHVGRRREGQPIVAGSVDEVVDELRRLADDLGLDAVNVFPVGEEREQRAHLGDVLVAMRSSAGDDPPATRT